jgi:hypothetical protein
VIVLSLAALILAAASADPTPALASSSPWWEKITYTISGDAAQQSCRYESSLEAAGAKSCDAEDASFPLRGAASGSAGTYTKITIERRFAPDRPDPVKLESGDTLLGGQVIALAIDATGKVRTCEILGASGDVRPAYGCREARAERFEASAGRATEQVRQGYMTILVYGHEEYLA